MMNHTSPTKDFNDVTDSSSPVAKVTTETSRKSFGIEQSPFANGAEDTLQDVAELGAVQYMTCALPPHAPNVRHVCDTSEQQQLLHQQQLQQQLQQHLQQRFKRKTLNVQEEQNPRHQQNNEEHEQEQPFRFNEQPLKAGQQEVLYLRHLQRHHEKQLQQQQEREQQKKHQHPEQQRQQLHQKQGKEQEPQKHQENQQQQQQQQEGEHQQKQQHQEEQDEQQLQQDEEHQHLFKEHLPKAEQEQIQVQCNLPLLNQEQQQPQQQQQQPENVIPLVSTTTCDCHETCGENAPTRHTCTRFSRLSPELGRQLKSAVLDARSYRVNVKSLVRKLSDTSSQDRCFRTKKENIRQSQRPDIPVTTKVPACPKNLIDITPQQMGSLQAGQGNKGLDTVGVVKGGVASLINKFQSQSQVSGGTKMMLRKSGLASNRDLKSATSISCESTDSGIQSNLADNLSTEVSKISLRGDSELTAAGERTFCRVVASPTAPRKCLNGEPAFPNIDSWDNEQMDLGTSQLLLELRSPNGDGQTEVRMSTGMTASVKSIGIMQQSKEKLTEFPPGHCRDVDYVLNYGDPRSCSNHALGCLRDRSGITETFAVDENCRTFNAMQFVNSESSLVEAIQADEINCERCTDVNSVDTLGSKTGAFNGKSHIVKECEQSLFLSLGEEKGQEDRVCSGCGEKNFEKLKNSSQSDNSCELSDLENGNSENIHLSRSSALYRSDKMFRQRKKLLVSVAKNCELKKCDPSTTSEDSVIKAVTSSATAESVNDVTGSHKTANCEQCQNGREENMVFLTTVEAEAGFPCLHKEGNLNNHGKDVGRQGHLKSSDKQASCPRDNLKRLRDLGVKVVQPNRTCVSPLAPRESDHTHLISVFNKADTVSFKDNDVPFPETMNHCPDVLPHKNQSLTENISCNDVHDKRSMVMLTGPAKVDASSTKSQQLHESKQQFDMYNAHYRANPLGKGLISKHKWTHTCPAKTEKIKVDNPVRKLESPKRGQQLGYSMFPGPRRESFRRQIRKPLQGRVEHKDKFADVKPDRKNAHVPLRQVSPSNSRQGGNLSSQDMTRAGGYTVHKQKQNLKTGRGGNMKSDKVNSSSGQNFGKCAVRNSVRAVGNETFHPGHYQGFRKHQNSSEHINQNTMKASEGFPLQPLSSTDVSPKGSRRSSRVQLNGSFWTNSSKIGIAQAPTRIVKIIGSSQTSILSAGQCTSSSSYHNKITSEMSDDVSLLCKKPLLRPGVVKSDMSAGNSMKNRAGAIRRNGQSVIKRPSSDTPQQMSFTKMYRSGSPLVSHRVCEGNSNKSGIGSGPVPTNCCLPRTDLKQDVPRAALNETKRANTGDGIRRTKLSIVPANYRRNTSWKGLNPFLNVEEMQEATTLQTVVKTAQTPMISLHKKTSPSTYVDCKALPRNHRTVKQGQGTVKTFHKYSSSYVSNTNQISQSVTEEARQVKECCIVVNSIQEAESVANCLLGSACIDFTPLRWDTDKDSLQEEEDNFERNASSDSEEVMIKRTDDFDVDKSELGASSSGKCCGGPKNRFKRSPHGPLLDRGIYPDTLRHQPCSLSKWKHSRKPFASVGEINLLDSSCIAENGHISQMIAVMPNVRRINIQPMICIPWNESIEHSQNMEYHNGQSQSGDRCVSVPEEFIAKTSKHHSPDIIYPRGQKSAQIPSYRARSVSTDDSKDIHRIETRSPFNHKTRGQVRSNACSATATSSRWDRLLDGKSFISERKESRSQAADPEEMITSCQQANHDSSPTSVDRTGCTRDHSEATTNEDEHTTLKNVDFKMKRSFVSSKQLTATLSNNTGTRIEFSKQRLLTSLREQPTNTKLQGSRRMPITDAPRHECKASVCTQDQGRCNTICADPVCGSRDHNRCDALINKTTPDFKYMSTLIAGARKHIRNAVGMLEENAECLSAVSELLPTVDESDFQDHSSCIDYVDLGPEYLTSEDRGLYFRESIIRKSPDNLENSWKNTNEVPDGNDAQTRQVSSVESDFWTKPCISEDVDGPCRKRRSQSEGDRRNRMGRVVQLRNLYEQRYWNTQTYVAPGFRYSTEKSKASQTNPIPENTYDDYSQRSLCDSHEYLKGPYYEDKLKSASVNRAEPGIRQIHIYPARLSVIVSEDDCHDQSMDEAISQSMHNPVATEDVSRSTHSSSVTEDVSRSVHSPSVTENVSRSMHNHGVTKDVSRSVHSPGVTKDVSRSVHSPGVTDDASRSVPSHGVIKDVTRSVHSPSATENVSWSTHSHSVTEDVSKSMHSNGVIDDVNRLVHNHGVTEDVSRSVHSHSVTEDVLKSVHRHCTEDMSRSVHSHVVTEDVSKLVHRHVVTEDVSRSTYSPVVTEDVSKLVHRHDVTEDVSRSTHSPVVTEDVSRSTHSPVVTEDVSKLVHSPVVTEDVSRSTHSPVVTEDVSKLVHRHDVTEDVSKLVHSPVVTEDVSKLVHRHDVTEDVSRLVHHSVDNDCLSQDVSHSVHSPDISQGVFSSVHSLGIHQGVSDSVHSPDVSKATCESTHSPGVSQDLYESLLCSRICQSVPQSQLCSGARKETYLKQYKTNKVPLLAAKFSGNSPRELRRSATVGFSHFHTKHPPCTGSSDQGKRDSSATHLHAIDYEVNDAKLTTHKVVTRCKVETDDPNMLEVNITEDGGRSLSQEGKAVCSHELSKIRNREIENHAVFKEQNFAKEMAACVENSTSKMLYYSQKTNISPSETQKHCNVEETTTKQATGSPDRANDGISFRASSESTGVNKTFLGWKCPKSGKDLIVAGILPLLLSNSTTCGNHTKRTRNSIACSRNTHKERTVTTARMSSPVMKPVTNPVDDNTADQLSSTLNEAVSFNGRTELSENRIIIHAPKIGSPSHNQDSLETSLDKDKKHTQYLKTDNRKPKTPPRSKEIISATTKEANCTTRHSNAIGKSSPEKVASLRHAKQKQNLTLDPKPPTGRPLSREPPIEVNHKSQGSTHHSDPSLEISQRAPGTDTDCSEPTLDIDIMYSTIDESADSFNCLFIENVRYLKDVSSEVQNKAGRHDDAPGTMKRKSSFSKQPKVAASSRSVLV